MNNASVVLWLCLNVFVLFSSHYFIVVINATVTDNQVPDSIRDDQLRPYNGPGQHYVAAVLLPDQYNPVNPYQLSSNRTTMFEGVTYKNVPLPVGLYRYFVRAYTIGPVCCVMYCSQLILCTLIFQRLSTNSETSPLFTISRSSSSDSSGAGAVIGAIAAVAVILLIVLIILIVLAIM